MCLLDRHWETDQDHFRHFLERFESHPCAECVFFCPEGTTITRASYERSKSFAQRSNRPKFEVWSSEVDLIIACTATSFYRFWLLSSRNYGNGKRILENL